MRAAPLNEPSQLERFLFVFIERDTSIIFAFLKGHCGCQVEKRINGTGVEVMTK